MIERNIDGISFYIDPLYESRILFSKDTYNEITSSNYNPSKIKEIIKYIYCKGNHYLPMLGIFEITNSCNFNCPFCFVHEKNDKKKHNIRFNDVKDDLSWLIEQGLLKITLTGGEPFLNPDFKDFYKFFKENGVLVSVYSNLSLLNDELIELFRKYPPFSIETSIYGFDDSVFITNTEQKNFNSTLLRNNIIKLKNNRINIIGKTALNKKTIKDFYEIKEWCRNNSIPYYYSLDVYDSYSGIDMSSYKLEQNEIDKIYVELSKESKKINNKIEPINKKCFECGAGRYGFHLNSQFELRPCMDFYSVSDYCIPINIGHIQDAFNLMQSKINYYKGIKICEAKECNSRDICRVCAIDYIKKDRTKQCFDDRCNYYKRMDSFIKL